MDSQNAEQKRPNSGNSDCILIPVKKRIASEVFDTEKLLKIILGKNSKELKHLRSLNHTWNTAACHLLGETNSLYVSINFPYHPRNASEEALSKKVESNFQRLTETIARSTELNLNFPPCYFYFSRIQLGNAAIQNFLSNCGHAVTKIHTVFQPNMTNANDGNGSEFWVLFVKMLFNQLPNLTQLFMVTGHIFEDHEPEYFKQLFLTNGSTQEARILPKLKRLKFNNSENTPIMKGILEAAINLEDIRMTVYGSINETKISGLVALIYSRKAHLLSYLSLVLDRHFLEPIESLSEANLRIKKLELALVKEGMSDESELKAKIVVNKLFHSVAQSLEKLESCPFLLYQALNLPQMPKLHRLNHTYIGPCRPLYPTNFKMSVTFPRLKSLEIFISVCKHLDPCLFNESFLGASYADQVFSLKSIEFNQQPVDLCVQNFPKMFPNIVSLNMGSLFNIPLAFKAFWSLAYLRKLEMIVIRGSPNDEGFNFENMALELEAGLTGFSTETCEQLALDFEKVDLATVESLRVNRSMLDAKNLRELYIRVADCFEEERTLSRSPLFSDVTGQFAFKMCPQVQVFIEVYAENEGNMQALMTDVQNVLGLVASVKKSDDDCLPDSFMRYTPCWVCNS